MARWTEKQFAEYNINHPLKGKGRGNGDNARASLKQASIAKISPNISLLKSCLINRDIKFESEYKFLPDRKFKFDLAILDKKLAIEYNGGIYMKKGGHTNFGGHVSNCRKLNLAQINGWRVLQYTNEDFKDGGITEIMWQIKQLLR